MYLRKNRVQSGETVRTYISIAHNVWSRGRRETAPLRSRPYSLVNLGELQGVDVAIAEEIVEVLQNRLRPERWPRGEAKQKTAHLKLWLKSGVSDKLRALARRDSEHSLQHHAPEERRRAIEALLDAEAANRPLATYGTEGAVTHLEGPAAAPSHVVAPSPCRPNPSVPVAATPPISVPTSPVTTPVPPTPAAAPAWPKLETSPAVPSGFLSHSGIEVHGQTNPALV